MQRKGAGAVYLNIFHWDIIEFLDTKKSMPMRRAVFSLYQSELSFQVSSLSLLRKTNLSMFSRLIQYLKSTENI